MPVHACACMYRLRLASCAGDQASARAVLKALLHRASLILRAPGLHVRQWPTEKRQVRDAAAACTVELDGGILQPADGGSPTAAWACRPRDAFTHLSLLLAGESVERLDHRSPAQQSLGVQRWAW